MRRLLPAVMADTADMAMAVNRLQSLEVAAQALAVTAVSRPQNPEVAAQALVVTAVSRLQSPASDPLLLKCPRSSSSGTQTAESP